jgi:CRP-like cAMP-binding protein
MNIGLNAAVVSTAYQQLREALAQLVELPDSHWDTLASLFYIKVLRNREHVFFPGATVHELVFVCEGLLRFYYTDADGTDANKAFIVGGEFACPMAAATLCLPVYYGVQALEPTTLLAARFTDFSRLYEQHPVFDRIGRKLAEQLLVHKELRARSLLQMNATERYLDFVSRYPYLVERVPQYHIASYLGITEVSLSRLRRTLAQKNRKYVSS